MKIEELSEHAIAVLTNNGFSRRQKINLDEEGFERYIYLSCDIDTYSPLHVAAWLGDAELAKELCESGINLDYEGQGAYDELTALEMAATCGKPAVVEVLLNYSPKEESIDRAHSIAENAIENCYNPFTFFWRGCEKLSGRTVDFRKVCTLLKPHLNADEVLESGQANDTPSPTSRGFS